MIGNHGLMGNQYERTDSHYSGTECDDEKMTYAEKSVYDVVGDVTMQDGLYLFSRKLVDKQVAMVDKRYNNEAITCADVEIEDGKFYSVKDLMNCKGSDGSEVFATMVSDIENAQV